MSIHNFSTFENLNTLFTYLGNKIRGINTNIGDLDNLTTTHKDNLVNAINDAVQGGTSATWNNLSDKPFNTIGNGLDVNLQNELEVAAKNTYIPSGTSSDRPISGQGVADALTTSYLVGDTAETTIDDADYVPFYDSSATAKRKSLWSNIKSVLKTYFDTLYAAVSHTHTKSEITDFPSLGTASSKDVPTSGNASSSQVVMGNDTRLTDSRTPTSHTHTKSQITDFPTLGTAASKDVPTSGNASSSQVVMGNDSRLTDSRTPTSHTHTISDVTDFPSVVSTTANGLAPKVTSTSNFLKGDGTWATPTNTKNTAGSTDTSSKIYLVGATSQAENPQTYSDNEVFATDGVLSSRKVTTKAITAMTGTGTAGQDKGSGATNRYVPSLWTFNSSITVADGEVYFIKIPVAGGTYGVWLSLNNGTNYYPVAISNAKARFTTHYAKDTVIAVTYESAGVCNCYARTGADALADVTGCFRVFDSYDSNTTYSAMSSSELTTGTATTQRTVRADYLKTGVNSLIDTKINALDVTGASSIGAGKTISAWSETNGKVSVTTQDISITKSQVSDFPTLGTSAAKDFETTPTSGSANLITSGGVYSYIDTMITQALTGSY